MKIGTKSILFGAHQFILHPIILFIAWWKLYGFPADYRLWIAFIVHDLGYWGKPNMDGDEGERHVEFGANIMRLLFGDEWGDFCLYHSRFYAKRNGRHFSRLCVADKLAIILDPKPFYLLRISLSGEIHEYMAIAAGRSGEKYSSEKRRADTVDIWYDGMKGYLVDWIAAHRDGALDTWTLQGRPDSR